MSTIDTRKKRGRPPVDTEEVSVRMDRTMLSALDEYAARNEISRPEAVRRALRPFMDYDKVMGAGEDPIIIGMSVLEKAALDAWIDAQPDQPSRPEAVRRLLEKALQ